MRYKVVIFDLFGTLVPYLCKQEYENMLEEMTASLSISRSPFQKLWDDTFVERARGVFSTIESNILHICEALRIKPDRAQIEAATRRRIEFIRRALAPREDAVETICRLKSSGRKIGLISDCSCEVPLLWKGTPLSELIDEAVFSCEVLITKPNPQIYLLACDRLGISPEDCLYVGDGGSSELSGAAEVGMSPVLIRVPGEDTGDGYRMNAGEWEGQTISALSEVLPLVFDH